MNRLVKVTVWVLYPLWAFLFIAKIFGLVDLSWAFVVMAGIVIAAIITVSVTNEANKNKRS